MPQTAPASRYPHRRFSSDEVLRMVDAGILAEDETLERRVDFEARRIELHSEPHADGRYAVVRVLADDDPADRPETNRTFRARDFIPR